MRSVPDHLTDAALDAAILTDYAPRRSELLRSVPAEHRAIYVAESHYITNCVPGVRPSDAVYEAIGCGLDRLTSPLAQAMRDHQGAR